MSVELHVFLTESKVPSLGEWQRAITEAGFDLMLDASLEPRSDSGFVSVVNRGVATGFELDFGPASDILEAYEEITNRVGERDVSLNFSWGGEMDELVSAVIAAGVLTKISSGLLFDPQDGTLVEGDEALKSAHRTVQEVAELK